MITSTSNRQIKWVKLLQQKGKVRKEENAFVAEGAKLVLETPTALCRQIFIAESYLEEWTKKKAECSEAMPQVPEEIVTDSVMKAMSDTSTPQGVLAIVRRPSYRLEELLTHHPLHLLLAEGIRDPGNLGTMFRTAEGAGATGVVLSPETVDLFNPKTVRSTMGSIYRVPFVVAEDWEETLRMISAAGVSLYAAHLQGEAMYDTLDYRGDCGFLIGNESSGLTEETAAKADQYVKIPMGGRLESLNAAMASGLLMYEVNRQRRQEGGRSS